MFLFCLLNVECFSTSLLSIIPPKEEKVKP